MMLALLLAVATEAATAQPMQKAATLPSPDADKAAAIASVHAALAGISARDKRAVLAQMRPVGTATAVMEKADGTITIRNADWNAYAGSDPGPERYEERMPDPKVEIEGAMATVSGRYTFSIDGKLGHCGFQRFDLVRDEGRWKIQNVTWSVRTWGCES